MSEVVVGLLGFACIVAIVVTLFKSKTLPSIAFIIFPMILGAILVFGGYYSWENIGKLIKSGFSSTGPTAALFVFSVLYFGIMTDAGMFDVIIGKLMLLVKDNVIGVCVMTCIIALIGHLDGGRRFHFLYRSSGYASCLQEDAYASGNITSYCSYFHGCFKPDAMGWSYYESSNRSWY